MGLPALVITDDMADELKDILTSAGIEVEKEIHNEDNILNQPNFSLNCKNKEGQRVRLGFGRSVSPPYELVVAIYPKPQSFSEHLYKKNYLVHQIIAVLKEHGAKDVGVESEDEDQNTERSK